MIEGTNHASICNDMARRRKFQKAASSRKQQLIIHSIVCVGDHRLYLEPWKWSYEGRGDGFCKPRILHDMDATGSDVVAPPHPFPHPNHQRCISQCGFLPARHLLVGFSKNKKNIYIYPAIGEYWGSHSYGRLHFFSICYPIVIGS